MNRMKMAPEGKVIETTPKNDEDFDKDFDKEFDEEFDEDFDDELSDYTLNDKNTTIKPKLMQSSLNYKEANSDDIEPIRRMIESKSCCPPMEILFLIPILYIATFSLTLIPGFIPLETYPNITKIDQPICAPIDHTVPGLPRFVIPLVIGLFAFIIVKIEGDILVATFSALLLAFDPTFIGIMGQSASTGLMAFFILMAYNIEHNILTRNVYGFSWFLNVIIAWLFVIFAPLFRPESLGSLVGLYICFLISCISEVCSQLGNSIKMILQTLKLVFFTYLLGIPLFAILGYMRSKFGEVQYLKRGFLFALFRNEFVKNEEWFLYAYVVLGIIFTKNMKPSYRSIVPLLQAIVATIATLFIPYESPGNQIPTKLFFIKLHLMLTASIVLSRVKWAPIKYGLPIVFVVIAGIYKMIYIAKYIMNNPDVGKNMFGDFL